MGKILISELNKDELFLSNKFDPQLSIQVTDSLNNVIAYSSSNSFELGKIFADSIICNQTGKYQLKLNGFNGFKGGYFF